VTIKHWLPIVVIVVVLLGLGTGPLSDNADLDPTASDSALASGSEAKASAPKAPPKDAAGQLLDRYVKRCQQVGELYGKGCEEQVARGELSTTGPLTTTAEVDATGYVKGLYLSAAAAGYKPMLDNAKQLLENSELNALVLDVKDDNGYLIYPTKVPMAIEIGADKGVQVQDWPAFMQWFKDHRVYMIARVVAFKDSTLAEGHPEWSIHDSVTGRIWRDANKAGWVEADFEEVQDYNIAVAVEAAEMGFDEIQYDYVRFPSDGALGRARLSMENNQDNRVNAIATFLARSKEALAPYGVKVAADVFGYVSWHKDDLGIGQQIEAIGDSIDVLSPMLYPSTFSDGLPYERQYDKAIAYPYEIVNLSTQRAVDRTAAISPDLEVRPWIQDFQDYAFDERIYTPDEIRRQMRGARDAGGRGWMLWDPAVKYTDAALITAGVRYVPNDQGKLLVLRYGDIAEPEGPGQRSPANLRADLERLLAEGYYPINVGDLVSDTLKAVPAGKRPVALTFDGGTAGHFRLLSGGSPDPSSAVGILWSMHDAHPADWPLRATFFLPPADASGQAAPFGVADQAQQKMTSLAGWGMELGVQAPGGSALRGAAAADVQGQLASLRAGLAQWLPDYQVISLALPDSVYPKDFGPSRGGDSEALAAPTAIVTDGGGPAQSPFAAAFNPDRIPRLQVTGAELDAALKLLASPLAAYASMGE